MGGKRVTFKETVMAKKKAAESTKEEKKAASKKKEETPGAILAKLLREKDPKKYAKLQKQFREASTEYLKTEGNKGKFQEEVRKVRVEFLDETSSKA